MAKLIATVGIQGSGKSTWAKEFVQQNPSFYRVNGDEIRRMVDGSRWNPKKEPGIRAMQEAAVTALLNTGNDVVWDNMNVGEKAAQTCRRIAIATKAELEWKEFNKPLDECILADRHGRGSLIGRAIIENTARRAHLIPWHEYRKLVIFDIDGTLTDPTWRQHLVNGEKKEWEKFLSQAHRDSLRWPIVKWAQELAKEYDIVIVSGRNERYYEHDAKTIDQLAPVPYKRIFMRANEDRRPDWVVKLGILRDIPKEQIAFAVDDRPTVIEKCWRASGIKVYPVGDIFAPEYW